MVDVFIQHLLWKCARELAKTEVLYQYMAGKNKNNFDG